MAQSLYREKKQKEIFRSLILLAGPTVAEEALHTIVQYADTAMVGRIGAQASAAVGLTITVMWLVTGPLFAMGVAVLALIARSLGAENQEHAHLIARQAFLISLILGIVLGAATLAASPFLPGWMGADPGLHRDASLYFSIICAPMLFRSFSIIFASVLRAAGDSRTPMIVNCIMNACNILLNQLLISSGQTFHLFGASIRIPGAGLGVAGAAIATASSVCLGGILMLRAARKHPLLGSDGFRRSDLRLNRCVMQEIVRLGIPVTLTRVVTSVGQVVFTSLVAGLGILATAAHSIALTAETAFYVPGYGMQAATSTLAGNALGRKDESQLRQVTRASLILAVSLMSSMALLLFLFPAQMMGFFTPDPKVIAMGAVLLRMIAVSEPLFAVFIIFEGIFQGIGDTKGPFLCSSVCMWVIRVFFTFLCVKLLGMGLKAVWACMIADNVLRCFWLMARYLRGGWITKFSRKTKE